jgi:hypothetical protein
MQDMGSGIINTDYIDGLIAKLEAATSEEELTKYAEDALGPLTGQLAGIKAQIEYLAPFLALLNPPTLAEVITWLTKFITAQIAPQVQAHAKCLAQVAVVTSEIQRAQAAIEKARVRIAQTKSKVKLLENKAASAKAKAKKVSGTIGL